MPQRPAIIFDAFGTLLDIRQPRHPYRQLLKLGKAQGRQPLADDTRTLMQHALDLAQAAKHLGIDLTPAQLADLQQALQEELASTVPYPDGLQAVALLQQHGLRVGVCSNLAAPYRQAIVEHYPTLDAYSFSCDLGVMKPDAAIYRITCESLGVLPEHTFMIGDSQRCDQQGPAVLGIRGLYLDRSGRAGDYPELAGFARQIIHSAKI